jgi:hypothetical protein
MIDPGPLPLEGITEEAEEAEGITMSSKRTPDKEEWLRNAAQAYDRAFGERDRLGEGRQPMTFSEIEEEAVREGNRLARWLLEGMISSKVEASGAHGEECDCPSCGKPAKRKREGLETREVHARPGPVSFERYEYYCGRCRKSFFSRSTSS